MQPLGYQIVGNQRHLIWHQHQNNVYKKDNLLDPSPVSGKAKGSPRRNQKLKHHNGNYQNNGIPKLKQVFRTFEQNRNILAKGYHIRNKFQIHLFRNVHFPSGVGGGKNLAVVGGNLGSRHKGIGHGKHNRHEKQYRKAGRHRGGNTDPCQMSGVSDLLLPFDLFFPAILRKFL